MKKALFLLPIVAFTLTSCFGDPGNSDSESSNNNPTPVITTDPKTTFTRAQVKTFENDIYEYNYTAEAKIKFKDAVSFSPANLSGTIQYDKSAVNTQYMHVQNLSGALVFDYTTYTYNDGLDLIKINADENKKFSITNKSSLPNNYQFETNSIGCILKSLSNNNNLSVTKSGDKYNLDLKTNFAQNSFLSVLNFIDSKLIVKALSELTTNKWGVGFSYNCYAKLNSDSTTVSSFHFDASVDIKDTIEVQFTFDQEFTKIGSNVKIRLPQFENTLTNENQISPLLAEIRNGINDSKKNYYDYKVKTGVDHGVSKTNPLGCAVNSTSAGYARREIVGNDVYFHNRLELDSDYKNKDQLGDLVEDYERYRAKLSTGEVYDIEDGVLKNTYTLMENYNNDAIDDYYMMVNPDWFTTENIKVMRKTDKNNVSIYSLGVSGDLIKTILEDYNKSIRIDWKGITDIKVYNIISDFEAKKAKVDFTFTSGKLTKIDIDLKGFYACETGKQVKFDFDLDIDFNEDKTPYKAPDDVKDVKLSASV